MSEGLSKEEKAALRDTMRERKRAKDVDSGQLLKEALEALPEADRALGEVVCAVIREAAPELTPRTFYGMPAYAGAGGKVVVFFQGGTKFKTRYSTVGFSDMAKLDDGPMWPTGFALKEWTPEVEARLRELVKRAAG